MKKFLLNILAVVLLTTGLRAQTIAPDFTATDINGVEHNLYEYLDAGKVVLLDVSATWCGPCWGFHQAHYLEDIHKAFGPDGTDEVVVLFYEGDSDTDSLDLIGAGSNTLGDWTEGVSYPIIDPPVVQQSFLDTYAELGFPTVSVICPDSKEIIADVYDQDLSGIIEQLVACGTINLTDLKVDSYSGPLGTCDESINVGVTIKNSGTVDMENFEVTAAANGTQIGTVTYDKTLAVGATADIDFGSYTLVDFATDITFTVTGNDDALTANNEGTVTVYKGPSTDNVINVKIEADEWTTDDPTTWKIEDLAGNILVQGAPLTPFTTFEGTFSVPNLGCHRFIIEDGFGDGLETPIEITDSQGNIIFNNSGFGSRGEGYFDVASLSRIEEVLAEGSISLYPTPVTEKLNLEWIGIKNGQAKIQISNTAGQVLSAQDFETMAGKNALQIPTATLAPGVYFVSIKSEGDLVTKRFLKQ